MPGRDNRHTRFMPSQFRAAREDDGRRYIEGYFAVFGDIYELWSGATESIAPTAFDGALNDDIRALIDHRTEMVLGRSNNSVHTLELRVDSHGLWGCIEINENDIDATNIYARLERGDVDQASFGFDILDEETEYRDDGSVHWTIKKVKLYEVSVCTFPAYEATNLSARRDDYNNIKKRQADIWRNKILRRIHNGTETDNAE